MTTATLLPALDRFLHVADAIREARKPKATKQQLAFLRAQDADAQVLTLALSDELEQLFDGLRDHVDAALLMVPVVIAEAEDPRDWSFVAAVMAALGLGDWRFAFLAPVLRTHYFRVAETTQNAMRLHFTLEAAVGLPDPIARRIIAVGGKRAGLVDLEAQTRRALFDSLARARSEGLGPTDAARLIRQYVPAGRFTAMEAAKEGAGVRYRAEMIARTETLHAQRLSTGYAGQDAGFNRYLAFDNRTGFGDAECTARDGREYTYDEMVAETEREHPQGTLGWAPVPGSQ